MGIAVALLMIVSLGWETWARLIVWLVIGLVVYFSYGRKHSSVQTSTALIEMPKQSVSGDKVFD
jgi:APA family basic amino acid/polyamine antiporter